MRDDGHWIDLGMATDPHEETVSIPTPSEVRRCKFCGQQFISVPGRGCQNCRGMGPQGKQRRERVS